MDSRSNTAMQIQQAIDTMPFGAVAATRSHPQVNADGELIETQVLAFLNGLRHSLEMTANRMTRMEKELHELRQQRAAVRDFLGVGKP